MKAVILAAGLGSRLTPYNDIPKTLTLLGCGKTILELQIEHLATYIPLENILIVVGYHAEMIQECFPLISTVLNSQYASQNTSKSLLLASEKIDDDLLWVNGDVVFHPDVIKNLLDKDRTSMVVNNSSVGEEEVKYRLAPDGSIAEVSKRVINALGEAVGINLFKRKDLALLKEGLELCASSDYFEKGIEIALEKGVKVWPCVIEAGSSIEIDFMTDLDRANKMVSEWKKG